MGDGEGLTAGMAHGSIEMLRFGAWGPIAQLVRATGS